VVAVALDHVWKYFDHETTPAVDDLTLDVRDREFLVLVGPSGCGKTTSLRMLAGLERPSYGRILMDGADITDLAPGRRDVAMVFQNYALYPNMTVLENLAFGPRVRHESKTTLRRRIDDVAESLGIRQLLDRRPSALSGGQRQRVALGRAIMRQPRAFLMDEPLSNLDAALRVQMRTELVRLQAEFQTTTVYVTHDQIEALTMGHRVAVLDGGRLLQVDTPTSLYEHPANLFVATFIGSPRMNIVKGSVSPHPDGYRLECLGGSWTIRARAPGATGLRSVRQVLIGVRPHDIEPASSTNDGVVHLVGAVEALELTGAELFVTVRVADSVLRARFPRTIRVQRDEAVHLEFSSAALKLFDPESEEALVL
jgi:multiple sugar transport system ATP-binding protein